ncbi:MAG: hypothetical protein COA73_00585 [Candidatus Hydrogenedentota bacterium]|nr:MAG: hypothetical protein COA73_00585 [Candidatus Hydrogenedentota bacterium]
MSENIDFIVNKSNLGECKFVPGDSAALEEGAVRFRVEKYAFTANNVTYGVAGDMLNYWQFFPAEEGWGRIPVWAIGTVAESRHDGLKEGDRYYGYFPMSSTLTVRPDRVSEGGFYDSTARRQELAPTYNQYLKVAPEYGIIPEYEDHSMLYRPLFATSFLIDDWLAAADFYDAKTLILSSASSKTSFGLAHQTALRGKEGFKIIGLTSPGNVAFVEGLGCYDQAITYDDISSIPNEGPVAYVDMAGSAEVSAAVHNHFADQLKLSLGVGLTHWQEAGQNADLPGAERQMFFAPDQIQKKAKELGPQAFQQTMGAALATLYAFADKHVEIVQRKGREGVESTYQEMLTGKAKPNQGFIVSMDS